jgi:hypothetical protein
MATNNVIKKVPVKRRRSRLFIFALIVMIVWAIGTSAYIYFLPNIIYNSLGELAVRNGLNPSGVPVNTLYTAPGLGSPSAGSFLLTTGANRDTLYTAGVLDLSAGPEILHVPNISDRYYSIELVDSRGDDFAVIGSATGNQAGSYLISGPGWQGQIPEGMTQIASPDNKVLLIGRVLVYNGSDVATAYGLSKQMQLTPQSS